MSNSLFTDSATQAARLALDGMSQKQQLISRNLANVDTPGYHAQQMDFQSALKSVFNRPKEVQLASTNANHLSTAARKASFVLSDRPGGSFRADENNVDVDLELTEMSEIGINYQAVSQAISKKLELLKTIASR
jgi:flagellar basal-body rod protein FlgB